MEDQSSRVRRAAARLFTGLGACLCLAAPVLANPATPEEKSAAARVARKVEKAAGTARLAKQEREALHDFEEEVEEYAEFHAKQRAKLGPRIAVDAFALIAEQKALAEAIAAKRAKARPGDIFRPEVHPLFRRLIAAQLEGPAALDARRAIRDGNPGQEREEEVVPVVLGVNAPYPPGAPRSSMPPSLLLTLPSLPDCLHYRFVGRDLILLDSVAQLIVDFLPDAVPGAVIQ
ncbi:MAG TPA: hypothetical protein VI669_19055 [Vicinamibacteria bacterium]